MIITGKTLRALNETDIKQCFFILLEHRSLGFHQMHMWSLSQFQSELKHGGGFGIFNNGKLNHLFCFETQPTGLRSLV